MIQSTIKLLILPFHLFKFIDKIILFQCNRQNGTREAHAPKTFARIPFKTGVMVAK